MSTAPMASTSAPIEPDPRQERWPRRLCGAELRRLHGHRRLYPLPWEKLSYDTQLDGYRICDLTKEQIEGAPSLRG